MSGLLGAQVGIAVWSWRRPLGLLAGALLVGPLVIGLAALAAAVPAGTAGSLRPPLARAVLTQGFGCTSLDLEPWSDDCPGHHWHSGIDLSAERGTPVVASGSGLAAVRGDAGGYGTHVILRHGAGVRTLYAHLDAALVADGEAVALGQIIGRLGSTGTSTGPHLHFEVRVNNVPVDPLVVVPGLAGEVMPPKP